VGNSRMGPIRPGLLAAAVATFLAGGVTSACGSDEPDQTVYCVDDNGTVVDPDYCDDYDGSGGMAYWFWMSSGHYPVGSSVSGSGDWRSSRVNPRDPNARANAGLPRTGKVGGTTVKGGGFGSGTSGGKSGGSVGG
jgi:hypothetical protein